MALALVLGFVAGAAYVDTRGQTTEAGATVETCAPMDAESLSGLETALPAQSDLSFRSGHEIGPLRGPFNGLSIVKAEVDGPDLEGAGDVGIWALPPSTIPGWTAGAVLFSLNPIARRVESPTIFPASWLRQYAEHGVVYDPKVLRALAPPIAASC